MPTATGLPKVGEVWERTRKLPPDWKPITTRFVVLSRSAGDYWSMRVYVPGQSHDGRGDLWVDPANAFRLGELKYIGEAGNETRKKLNLPPGPKQKQVSRGLMMLDTRLDALYDAINSRDWDDTEFQYDRVRSQFDKLTGTRGRLYDKDRS